MPLVGCSVTTRLRINAAGIIDKPATLEYRNMGLYGHASLNAADNIATPPLQVLVFRDPVLALEPITTLVKLLIEADCAVKSLSTLKPDS